MNGEVRRRFVIIDYRWFELAGWKGTEPDFYLKARRFVKPFPVTPIPFTAAHKDVADARCRSVD